MSLFPVMKSVEEKVQPKPHKEYQFDFKHGTLTGKKVSDKEALKVWIYKALHTPRYKHVIYSWDYGQDLEEIIGQGYEKGFINSEVERRIKDCLLIHPHIKDCTNFNIQLHEDQLQVQFTILTIYGEVTIDV